MTDLTAITTPYGLLDPETQRALKEHGGPYESYKLFGWENCTDPSFFRNCTYRVKPTPPKPREWWLLYDKKRGCYTVYSMIETPPQEAIRVREVIE